MKNRATQTLATICCMLGLSLTAGGLILCPRAAYADQGMISLTPCSVTCFGDCIGRNINNCPGGGGSDGCNQDVGCSFCRCKLVMPDPNNRSTWYCYCF